ncbi:MAG TPA: hypothetical protein VFE62_19300 [Gemmataceae bacterium]|nr:hypothetical protein [Gemmataceae bacterium]
MDRKSADTHAMFHRSRDAFLRDLPELLANPKYDRWSAVYLGDERIALVKTLAEATRICRERGISASDCFIGCVFPHCEEVDTGFYEVEEIDE